MKRYIKSTKTRWQDTLPDDVYERLAECKSWRTDIIPIADAIYRSGTTSDKEDAVTLALEHLASNNRIFDYSESDYKRAVAKIGRNI